MSLSDDLETLVLKLFEINALKFGDFKLKSGIQSPVYFDLRVIVSHPNVVKQVVDCIWKVINSSDLAYNSVCGVPYTALPLASVLSVSQNIPMLIKRKETKDYGTKKQIEGSFNCGDCCLIIEDVVTTGSSVLDTVKALNSHGIVVRDAIVLLDREQGGKDNLATHRINLHSVLSLRRLLEVLNRHKKITDDERDRTLAFLDAQCRTETNGTATSPDQTTEDAVGEVGEKRKAPEECVDVTQSKKPRLRVPCIAHDDRAALCKHPLTKKLFKIMMEKQSNLCFSADVTEAHKLLKLVDQIGPHICLLKTHIDIVVNFAADIVQTLRDLAVKHNFLIFEDRKFADVGSTVQRQYVGGVYKISDWAHITNAHVLPGPGVVTGLKQAASSATDGSRGLLLIAEMSSAGSLATGTYTEAAVKLAEEHKDFVLGFICTSIVTDDPTFVHMTPGVRLAPPEGGDGLGQQYLTPQEVIGRRGCDVMIVGRGILEAPDPVEAAKRYQEEGYVAHLAGLNIN